MKKSASWPESSHWRYLALWLVTCLVVVPAAAQTGPVPAASGTDIQLVARELSSLAESGRFDVLLDQLKAAHHNAGLATVTDLIGDLERFEKNQADRRQEQLDASQKALSKISRYVETGRIEVVTTDADGNDKVRWGTLEDALIAVINAHGLSDDPEKLLTDPQVNVIVQRVIDAARTAEDNADWIEALSLYRLLDLLYEDTRVYRDKLKEIARHMRVLQLYVPDEFHSLYQARAQRRARETGEDFLDIPITQAESWSERLKWITSSMLSEALNFAATNHVDGKGYLPLVRGGIDNLFVLINNKAVAKTFPSLRNQARLANFKEGLGQISASLASPGKQIDARDAFGIIKRIINLNETTLRLPERVIVYELTEGAMGTLDDFTSVIWPNDLEHFRRNTDGKFVGVGIQISRRDGRLVVVSPLENTPAMRIGVKAGDIIAQVDGQSTDSWSLDKAVREITGKENTLVKLGIERTGHADLLVFKITRAQIVIESIRGWQHKAQGGWDFWIDPEQRIAYVRLSQFIPQTVDDLDAAVSAMQKDGPINGLILDLRFNPGGLLSSAIDVSDRFVREGPIVFTVNGKNKRTQTNSARRYTTYRPFPVTVLINQGSASASEIVAGALQDYGRALIIGTRSFGKGSVQDIQGLDRNIAALKITTHYYQLPHGRIIHRKPNARQWGIEPDVVVEMTNKLTADAITFRQEVDVLRDSADLDADADGEPQPRADEILARGLDPQLETALLVLKTRLLARHITMAQARKPIATP